MSLYSLVSSKGRNSSSSLPSPLPVFSLLLSALKKSFPIRYLIAWFFVLNRTKLLLERKLNFHYSRSQERSSNSNFCCVCYAFKMPDMSHPGSTSTLLTPFSVPLSPFTRCHGSLAPAGGHVNTQGVFGHLFFHSSIKYLLITTCQGEKDTYKNEGNASFNHTEILNDGLMSNA